LHKGPLRDLFDAFRKEVLSLDPCVTEEIFALYVAYKSETNFVDVVPHARRLQLTLNTAFADISDPRGICKDVSGGGRWGTGDVEVEFSSLDELPYVMGLVRQSFEQQMGNGADP
jgi:predicted transport protein